MLRMLWIALGAAACSGRPAPAQPIASAPHATAVADAASADAPSLDRDLPQLIERSLALYRDTAAALEASGRDCAAATARLGQLARTYRAVVDANARVLHDGRAAELRDALAPRDQEFNTAAAAVMHAPTMSACAADPAFSRALDELFAPP